MRTETLTSILSSENRKNVVRALFAYPKRLWSCSSIEEVAAVSHATAFRTIKTLVVFGVLRSTRVNRKDVIYELTESLFVSILKDAIDGNRKVALGVAKKFASRIRSAHVYSIILYGSSVKGNMTPESDIDILVVLHDLSFAQSIKDIAAELSSKVGKTIAVTVMTKNKINKKSSFISSIRENMVLLYGKNPL